MASFNIDGISDDKLEALLAYLDTNNVDIMNLQETKVAEFPERFYHRGYHIIHNPPPPSKQLPEQIRWLRHPGQKLLEKQTARDPPHGR